MTDTDLDKLADELKRESKELADKARESARQAETLEAERRPTAALDPDFEENLQKALAEPQQRLREIAKLAR